VTGYSVANAESVGIDDTVTPGCVTRRDVAIGFACVAACAVAYSLVPSLARAAEAAANAADGKTPSVDWLELHNTHTNETLKVTFRNTSGFIPDALQQLDKILGDHRSGEHREMDPQLYVLLVDLAAAADHEPRYEIISAFRASETNEKLRSNGGGQAKNSQHIQGKAIDVRLKGVPCERLRDLAVGLKRGGVGYYAKSDFVHVDTARVRYWEG
jgi:uncharacterized protein YcbK (DUF882 family)